MIKKWPFDKIVKHAFRKWLFIFESKRTSNKKIELHYLQVKIFRFTDTCLILIGYILFQSISLHSAYGQSNQITNSNVQSQSIMNNAQTPQNNRQSSFLREMKKLEDSENSTLSPQSQNRTHRENARQRLSPLSASPSQQIAPSSSSRSRNVQATPTRRPGTRQNNSRSRNQQTERYQTAYERYLRQRANNNATNNQGPRYSRTQQTSSNQTSGSRSTTDQNAQTDSVSSTSQRQSSSTNNNNRQRNRTATTGRLNTPTGPINGRANAANNRNDLANQPNNTQNSEEALTSDPWAPLGLRGGSFLWFPGIDISTGYTTNAARSATGESAFLMRIAPELRLTSDWSRHSLTGLIRGTYTTYFDSDEEDDKELEANLNLNLNISENTTGNLLANYSLRQETNASSIASTGTIATTRADETRLRGEAGIQHNLSTLALNLRGSIERTIYDNGGASDEAQSNNDDRDQTEYRGTIRLTYQPEARISPFAQTEIGLRRLDNPRATGFNRDSTSYGLSGGIALNMAPKLSGEAALGYRAENLRDKRLDDISGLTLEASLLWSPTPLTTVEFSTSTNFDTTTIANSPGIITHQGNIILTHALRRNLLLTVEGSIEHQDTRNSPLETTTYRAGTGVNWHMTRWLQTTANYNYEQLQSSTKSDDYTANEFRLGVRLER